MNDYTQKDNLIVTIQTLGKTLYFPKYNLKKRCKLIQMLDNYEEELRLSLEFEDKIVIAFLHWLDNDELLLDSFDDLLAFCYLCDYLDYQLNDKFYIQFCRLMKKFGYQRIKMINWYMTHACDKTIIKGCLKQVICRNKKQISEYYNIIPKLEWSFFIEVLQSSFLNELNEIYTKYVILTLEYNQLVDKRSKAENSHDKMALHRQVKEKDNQIHEMFEKYGKKSLVYATTL